MSFAISRWLLTGRLLIIDKVKSRVAVMIVLILSGTVASYPGFAGQTYTQNQQPKSAREKLLFDRGWKLHPGDAASPQEDFGFDLERHFAKAGSAGVSAATLG